MCGKWRIAPAGQSAVKLIKTVIFVKRAAELQLYRDHAGGHLLFEETGGIIKDFNGNAIDFGQGRKITGETNFGMVAARPAAFDGIMQAVKAVLDERTR